MTQANPDVDYFHINRLLPYSPHKLLGPGDAVDIGGQSNPHFRYYEKNRRTYPVTQSDGNTVQVPGVRFLKGVHAGEINCPNLPAMAHEFSLHLAGLVGELIWEDVRTREFPHLPSRQRCVWLIRDMDGVRHWLKRLGVSAGSHQVLRVRCQGRMHIASEHYLLDESASLEAAVSMARRYWLGVAAEPNTEEIIFEGRMTVREIVPPEQLR